MGEERVREGRKGKGKQRVQRGGKERTLKSKYVFQSMCSVLYNLHDSPPSIQFNFSPSMYTTSVIHCNSLSRL